MNTHKPTAIWKIEDFAIHIYRKNIKGTYLSVHPPHGQVKLKAPHDAQDEDLKLFICDKLPWIHIHRRRFSQLERQTPREYVSGEDHYFLGHRYRLRLIVSTRETPRVVIENKSFLKLYIRRNTSVKGKEKIMHHFLRTELYERIPALIEKWAPIIQVRPHEVLIKKMKTRWGTCLPSRKRIWLNLELAKYAPHLLEYVFVHEMVHFLERRHGPRFHRLMTSFLPAWRVYEGELKELVMGFFPCKDV